jgi:hypothetical protein
MIRLFVVLTIAGALVLPLGSQTTPRPPVIDMHVHSTNTSPQDALGRMRSLNIRYLFVSSLSADLPKWSAALDASQFAPGLVLPCDRGLAPITGRPCFEGRTEFPTVAWLRAALKDGRIKALGEVEPQYVGMSPADPRMEPYWQLSAIPSCWRRCSSATSGSAST